MKTRSKKKRQAKPIEPDENKLAIRAATIEVRAADGDTPAAVIMSVSSEEPVLTYGYFNDEYQRFFEILDHAESSVDLSRAKQGLVILDRHYGDQVGLMTLELKEKKLGGPVEFCSGDRAQEISQDAAKQLRRNVSVGYTVDASSYRLEGDKDGIPVVRAMSWMPYEASFEPVPADTTVGVNRASKQTQPEPPADKPQEKRTMTAKQIAKLMERAAKYGIPMEKASELCGVEDATEGSVRAAIDALIVDAQTATIETRDAEIVEFKERKPEDDVPAKQPVLGGDAKTEAEIVRKYSVLNVMRNAAGITVDVLGKKTDVGFEREIDAECRKMGMGSQRGGQFIIPHAALCKRDFTVSGTSSYSIETDLMSDDFIDVLRNKYVIGQAGVQFMTGVVGNLSIPKMTVGNTGYWLAESAATTESEPTLGQVTGTPHTCGVMTDISRRLLIQSTPDAEQMVRNEIVERIARTIQIAVFAGSGAAGQPSAITGATGINVVTATAGTPTYAEMLDFPGSIMTDSADSDNQMWIMTAEVWAKLAATDVGTGTDRKVLDFQTKTCLGYPYLLTEDIPANSCWFGSWNSVMIAIWGAGVDLNMDTATLSSSGGLRIVGLQDVDVMVRLGQALAYDLTVTS